MFFIISLLLLAQHIINIKCELIKDPSLKPVEPFIVTSDADTLKKELNEDYWLNRDTVAHIICRRTLDQRYQIKDTYNGYYAYNDGYGGTGYWSTLLSDLQLCSVNSMENLYELMFSSYDGQLTDVLYKALTGKWKEGGVVEEIVCANDEDMKDRIARNYEIAYKCKVEEHLKTIHKDDANYQEAIHKYCWAPRCQEKKMKPEDIDKEVKCLREIDPKKDKEGFKKKLKELLDKQCEPDLKEIFNKYKKDDHRISDAVDEAFEGDEKTVFNVLVRYFENTCMFYADELYHAVHGFGTDLDKINRIVLTRCERDLNCILKEYKNKHHKSFTKRLREDVASEPRYLECIRSLCGKT